MAMGFKKGADLVLESRHLVGVFLLMVVISGVVFSLGYLLGRNQVETKLRTTTNRDTLRTTATGGAPGPASKAQPTSPPAAPASSEWDFYRSGDSKKAEPLQKMGKTPAVASKVPQPVPTAGKVSSADSKALTAPPPPAIPRGAIVLQVAALTKETDALTLAEVLQKKAFPAFVLPPTTDHYYRVQVGPYADEQSADFARRKLEKEGFKAILKR